MDNTVRGETADIVMVDEVQDFSNVEVPEMGIDFSEANFVAQMNALSNQNLDGSPLMPGQESQVLSKLGVFSVNRYMIKKATDRLKLVQFRAERRNKKTETKEAKKALNKLKRKQVQTQHNTRKSEHKAANKSAHKPY